MNLAQGEKLVQVLIANKAFGEINPGTSGLSHLELVVKLSENGKLQAEMKLGYETGALAYSFPDLDTEGLRRIRSTLEMYSRITNQPGVFREYDFGDCQNDEEMRYRMLSIPEYRAVAKIPRNKVVSLEQVKDSFKCPVCKSPMPTAGKKCQSCGAFCYKDGGKRYFESETASFFPLMRHGEAEAQMHLCRIDYINAESKSAYPHITYIEEFPYYLGAVYTFTPPAKNLVFNVILNKPKGIFLTDDFLAFPYRTARVRLNDLKILNENGCQLFKGTGTQPFMIVSFPVWDYACLEEIGSHVNYILYKYNCLIEEKERTN